MGLMAKGKEARHTGEAAKAIEGYKASAVKFSGDGEYGKAARQLEYACITARVYLPEGTEVELMRKEEEYLIENLKRKNGIGDRLKKAETLERLIAISEKTGGGIPRRDLAKEAIGCRMSAATAFAETADYSNAAMQMEAARKTAKNNCLEREERDSAILEIAYLTIGATAGEGANEHIYAARWGEKAAEVTKEYSIESGSVSAIIGVYQGMKGIERHISNGDYGMAARMLRDAVGIISEQGPRCEVRRLAEIGAECFEKNARHYLAIAAKAQSDRMKVRFLDGALHEFNNAAKLAVTGMSEAEKRVNGETYERLAELCNECIREVRMGRMSDIMRG